MDNNFGNVHGDDRKAHQENLKKEFEAKEAEAAAKAAPKGAGPTGPTEEAVDVDSYEDKVAETDDKGTITNLGRVAHERNRSVNPDDPKIKRMRELTGYHSLDTKLFPSGGKFYRDDFEIHIRAARVAEIRDFSTMNEDDINDVDEKLNEILVGCCKVMFGQQRGSYRDILEEDRIYVILSIRELTFKQGEQQLMMPVGSRKCSGVCSFGDQMELKTSNLQFERPDMEIEKYYDDHTKSYAIETKNYGTIYMAPPTIGVMRQLSEWIKAKEQEGKKWDKSSVTTMPYLQREWRGWSDREIFQSVSNMQGWDATKYALIYRLAERMRVGVKQEMIFDCEGCGAEITVPLTFPGGLKSLFVISDISSELL
tara:strand:- start:17732 stop:18835 length:1104 start_codon:yes stop_codon:yes gene_type:complete